MLDSNLGLFMGRLLLEASGVTLIFSFLAGLLEKALE